MVPPRPSPRARGRQLHARCSSRQPAYLGGSLVVNLGDVYPSLGLKVLWIVWLSAAGFYTRMWTTRIHTNLLWRVDGRVKVRQQASSPNRLVVDEDLESLIRLDNQRVQSGCLCDFRSGRVGEVLFFILARLGVTVSEDKVDFVGCPALVWAKHDCEGSLP